MDEKLLHSLISAFHYNPETGEFHYRVNRRPNVNKSGTAGRVAGRGYVYLSYKDREYLAHRVAFAIMEGVWPLNQVDHINGVKTDNRFCNLRHATQSQNQCNRKLQQSKSGARGVYRTPEGKWKAEIKYEKIVYRLGHFGTIEDAKAIRKVAERFLHAEFASREAR